LVSFTKIRTVDSPVPVFDAVIGSRLMAKKILVVDDEKRLVSVVKAYLESEGFVVVTAANGREALIQARQEKPDLILLDIMMPEMDGYEFIRLHRKERETPIILLTAKVEEDDKVIGLELGGDDYVTKPFRPRELMARVRAVLRRTGETEPRAEVLRVGEVSLDREDHIVKVRENHIDLTPSEFDLLAALMSTPGRAYSRLELLDRIQGTAYEGYERTIDVHVKNLRSKIEADPKSPSYIQTVYGVGYRFARE
jgi:DNA-binding response OmpR family regulator